MQNYKCEFDEIANMSVDAMQYKNIDIPVLILGVAIKSKSAHAAPLEDWQNAAYSLDLCAVFSKIG